MQGVIQKAIAFGFVFLLFQLLYIFCMRYMEYFDAEAYKELNGEEYMTSLAAKNNKTVNFQ